MSFSSEERVQQAQVIGKVTAEVLTDWQLKLQSTLGSVRVYDEVLSVFSNMPDIQYKSKGHLFESISGSLRAVVKAENELVLLKDKLSDISQTLKDVEKEEEHETAHIKTKSTLANDAKPVLMSGQSSVVEQNGSNTENDHKAANTVRGGNTELTYSTHDEVSSAEERCSRHSENQPQESWSSVNEDKTTAYIKKSNNSLREDDTNRKSDTGSTTEPLQRQPLQPSCQQPLSGQSTSSEHDPAAVTVLNADEIVWKYIHIIRAGEINELKKFVRIDSEIGPDMKSHGLKVTAYSKAELDAACEKITIMYQNIEKANIVKWSFWLPVDKKVICTDIDKHLKSDLVKVYMGDGIPISGVGSSERTPNNSIRYNIIGPRTQLMEARSVILDFILKSSSSQGLWQYVSSWGSSPAMSYSFITSAGLNIKIFEGDLTKQVADAIVNPSNIKLIHGGGAARCIAMAAGHELQHECRDFIEKNGILQVALPMHTTAGLLQPSIKHVIHVAGPDIKNDIKFDVQGLLVDTFFNCMEYADAILGAKSIAIPAISSGNFGIPKDFVASRAFEALLRFNEKPRNQVKSLCDISFVNIDSDTTREMIRVFQCLVKATDIESTSAENLRVPTQSKQLNISQTLSSSKSVNSGSSGPFTGEKGFANDFRVSNDVHVQVENSGASAKHADEIHCNNSPIKRTGMEVVLKYPSDISVLPSHRMPGRNENHGDAVNELCSQMQSVSVEDKERGSNVSATAITPNDTRKDQTRVTCSDILKASDVRVIVTYNQCFWRCIAVHGVPELQLAERLGYGFILKSSLSSREQSLAEKIKSAAKVLLTTAEERLQKFENQLNITLDSKECTVRKIRLRVSDLYYDNGSGRTDILKLLAVSYFAKTQIHLYRRDGIDYRLYLKYPSHAFKSRQPIMLLYHVGGKFDVLLENNCCRRWNTNSMGNIFEDYANTASAEDKSLTLEQLIDERLMPSSHYSDDTGTQQTHCLSSQNQTSCTAKSSLPSRLPDELSIKESPSVPGYCIVESSEHKFDENDLGASAGDDVDQKLNTSYKGQQPSVAAQASKDSSKPSDCERQGAKKQETCSASAPVSGTMMSVYSWNGSLKRIAVYHDSQHFYRCIAIHFNKNLQSVKRDDAGWSLESSRTEKTLASSICDEVMQFLRTLYQGERLRNVDGGQSHSVKGTHVTSYTSMRERISKMSMRPKAITDELEYLAVAFLAKCQILVYEKDKVTDNLRLLVSYPSHAVYTSHQPVRLLYKSTPSYGTDCFDVLLTEDCKNHESTCIAKVIFDECAKSASRAESLITWEQLIDPSNSVSQKMAGNDVDQMLSASTKTHQGSGAAQASKDSSDYSNYCVICMDSIQSRKPLSCGHVFCAECIDDYFKKCQPKCPSCGKLFGVLRGNQPTGTFQTRETSMRLAGYEKYGTIEIYYSFPDGIQTSDHPNPGQPYKGTRRSAYLPASPEGREVCCLLKRAFDAGLVFTVDRSVTTGADNRVVWNNIHHKTSPTGSFGYPDPTYLARVKDELAAKGIVRKESEI